MQNGSERRRQAEDDHLLGHNISSLSKAVLVTSQDAGPLETKACKCLCVCVEQVLIRLNELPHQHTQYTRLTSIKPNQFSVWFDIDQVLRCALSLQMTLLVLPLFGKNHVRTRWRRKTRHPEKGVWSMDQRQITKSWHFRHWSLLWFARRRDTSRPYLWPHWQRPETRAGKTRNLFFSCVVDNEFFDIDTLISASLG